MIRYAINFVGFQLGWFACVLGAASGRAWIGPLVVAALVALHLSLARQRTVETLLIAAALAGGLAVDSLFVALGAFSPNRALLPEPLTTVWMLAMWANFATTLNVSLSKLQGHGLIAAALGAVFGPLAYYSGARLGAAVLHPPLAVSLLLIAAGWAIATPALVWVARRAQIWLALASFTSRQA